MRLCLSSATWLIGLYFFLFVSSRVRGAAKDDPLPTPDERLPHLRQGWLRLRELDEAEKKYQVNASLQSPSEKTPTQMHYEIQIKPPNWLCRGEKVFDSPGTEILCQTPFYAFDIVKKKDEGDWILGNFNKLDSPSDFRRQDFGVNRAELFYPLTSFGSMTLSDLANDGSFRISNVQTQEGGKLRVQFNYPVKGRKGEQGRVTGWMVVEPKWNYVVLDSRRTSTLVPGSEFVVHREVEEAKDAAGGFRCTLDDDQVVNLSSQQITQRKQREYHDYSYRPLPEEVFRLSHYGLPEPLDTPPVDASRRWLWLWIALAAAVLLGAAMGLRLLASRKRSTGV